MDFTSVLSERPLRWGWWTKQWDRLFEERDASEQGESSWLLQSPIQVIL